MLLLSRISKNNYHQNYFERNINYIKKTWEGINVLITRKRTFVKQINSLKCQDQNSLTTDPSEILDILNKHFASIGDKLVSKMSNSLEFSRYLPKNFVLGVICL